MTEIKISDVVAQPGTKVFGAIHVGKSLVGLPIQIPIVLINGRKPGRTVWIFAGIDGDEIESIIATQMIINEINPLELEGAIVGFLATNPLAVNSVSRSSPIDGKCLNEVFPGDPTGTFTDRLACQIFTMILDKVKENDIVLSLHGGGQSVRAAGLIEIHGTGDKIEDMSLELAKFACNPYMRIIVRIDEQKGPWVDLYKGYLTREIYKKVNVAPITLEAGGLGLMKKRDIQGHRMAIQNILINIGMLNGKVSPPENDVIVIKENVRVPPTSHGFWLPEAEAGDKLEKDSVIARIVDIFGSELEVLKAPFDGIVLYMRGYGVVNPLSSRLQDIYGANMGKLS